MQIVRDIELDNLKDLVNRHFSPNIFVAASEKARAICHKNLLTPAEFLRPFGFFRDAQIKFAPMERERQLSTSFHLNFVDAEEFECPKKEMIDNEIKEIINQNAPERLEQMVFSTKNKNALYEELCRVRMPWFDKVTDSIFALTRNQFDMNFLDQPWAAFYMITSKEADPSQEVVKLVNENDSKLNNIFNINRSDKQIPRVVLVIYEYTADESNKIDVAQKVVARLQSEYKDITVKLIIINTTEDEKSYENWFGHLYQTYYYPKEQIDYINNDQTIRGRKIPKSDRDMLKNIIFMILKDTILPFISRKIRALEAIVQKKRGLTNTFKKFFAGNAKTDSGDRYGLNPDEICLRSLADIYFLLEDYDSAAANYKLFSSEIKGKSSKFYANSLEMTNICILLIERAQKKDTSFKKCYELYLESRDPHKFVVRTAIFQIYHCVLNNSRDEAQLLMEVAKNFKEYLPVINCIFYEQYAMMYLRCTPIWPRKYAFSMVLAGFTYNQGGHRKYGQRCYYLANTLYSDISWSMIQEHINTVLGKNSFQSGDSLESIRYFRKALENISQNDTPERHATLIKEAFSVISQIQYTNDDSVVSTDNIANYYEEIIKFPFPKIIDEGFDITIEDDFFNFINDRKTNKIFEGTSQQEVLLNADSDQLWFNMGRRLTAFILKRPEVNRFEPYDELSFKMMDCVYTSDKIKILKMPREAYIGEEIIVNVRVDNPYKVPLEIQDFRLEYDLTEVSFTGETQTKTLESKKEDFVLAEAEQKHIPIVINLDREGVIKVRGVRWKIDCIEGKHNFQLKKQFINQIKVCPALGKVTLNLEHIKNQICYGEVIKCNLNLQNTSTVNVDKVYIINSFPEMTGFDSQELGTIKAGATSNVPIIMRGSMTGNFEVRFLIKVFYSTGKARYYRMVFPLDVQSSFIPKYFTTPCFDKKIISLQFVEVWAQSFQKHIANLDKVNGGLTIEQVILFTNKWKLVETGMHRPIYRKEENFLHCYIEKCPIDPSQVEEDYYKIALKENVNLLTISENEEPLLDFKACVDFFNLTFKKFKMMQSVGSKSQNNPDTISLAVIWRFNTEKETLRGLHYLYKIPLNSNLAPLSQSIVQQGGKKLFEELPVQLRILSPQTVKHNFDIHPTCSVPIKLRLSNVSGVNVLSFRVEALNSDIALTNREKSGNKYFVWEGVTDMEVADLKPMENCTVDFNLMFFETGVYDISRFRFNFYLSKRTGELAKNVNQSELVSSQNYERIVFSSEKDQCLITISS